MIQLLECSAEGLAQLAEKQELAVWGAGGTLKDILYRFKEYEFQNKIKYIVDSDPKKQGICVTYDNVSIPVMGIEKLPELTDEDTVIVIASIFYDDIKCKLEEMGVRGRCYIFPTVKYDYMLDIKNRMREEEVADDLIVFRSSLDYSDNARVLFDYMIAQGLNRKYRIVWAVADIENFRWLNRYENVDVCSVMLESAGEAEKYYRYKYTAKYFFVSHTLNWLQDRKPGQVVFNLWHGCGYKKSKVGKSHRNSFEYTCVTGPLYKKYQTRFFDCAEEKAVVTGHPKTDLFFTADTKALKQALHLEGYAKLVVWMPTFRNSILERLNECTIACETGFPIVRSFQRLEELNAELEKRNMLMIVKLHQYQETSVYTHRKFSNIQVWDSDVLVGKDIQVNEFLACADALISDYSSTAVDFLSVDRMMGFAIDDYEEYTKGRLFLFDPLEDYLPGYILREYDELVEFIDDVAAQNDKSYEKRQRLMPQMMRYRDGESCRRILEYLEIR